jgi:hypothetical protein
MDLFTIATWATIWRSFSALVGPNMAPFIVAWVVIAFVSDHHKFASDRNK